MENKSGGYHFNINGRQNVRFTDTYANVNNPYSGPVNSDLIFSGGWSDITSTSDGFGGMISEECAGYPTGIVTGCSLLVGSKGPSGEIHFVGNGALGHVTIDAPPGSNPAGADNYNLPNSLRFNGSFGTTGQNVQIKVVPSGNIADAGIGLQFYNFATGNYLFTTENGATQLVLLRRNATAGDGLIIDENAQGVGPVLSPYTFVTNTPTTIEGAGTGNIILGGHIQNIAAGTSTPTCGTGCASVTAGSTDSRGSFTTTTSITTATLNFGTTWGAAPVCTVSDNSTAAVTDINTISTSALTLNFASSLSTVKVYYICMQ